MYIFNYIKLHVGYTYLYQTDNGLYTYRGDVQILRALKAGAQAYLLKNALYKELAAANPGRACGGRKFFLRRHLSRLLSMQLMMR